jgi:hypothetical protein
MMLMQMLSRQRCTVPVLRRLVNPTRHHCRSLLHSSTPVSSQRLNGVPVLEEELQADADNNDSSGFLQGEVSERDNGATMTRAS